MKKLLLLIFVSMFIASCGGDSKNDANSPKTGQDGKAQVKSTIDIKFDGKEVPFVLNNGWQTVQKYGVPNDPTAHALRWITLRNYEFDHSKTSPDPAFDKLTTPEQVKIFLSVHDEAGTDVTTPIKVATYPGGGAVPMSFELINVYVFRDGKEERLYVYPGSENNKASYFVKITAVDGDTITGEINVTGTMDGKELSVKGPFTAKVRKR